jgi:16S rRNA processing protein RimM
MPRGRAPYPGQGEGGLGPAGASRERGGRATTPPSPGSLRSPPSPSRGEGEGDLVLLGEFGRAHGLKGEVRLKSFTADPAAIATYGPLVASDGRSVTLTSVRQAPGGAPDLLVAGVAGVATREAAEALNRVRLSVAREKLGPAEEDEFFAADLIGLAAQTPEGEALGTVVAVPDFGGGDLLEIAPARGSSAFVPFTKAFVPTVDLAARRVVVDAPDLFAPAGEPPPDADRS